MREIRLPNLVGGMFAIIFICSSRPLRTALSLVDPREALVAPPGVRVRS